MAILLARSQLNLHTRCENQIVNEINREPIRPGDLLAAQDYRARYPYEQHRPTSPSRKYNCHGLSFANRRTWIKDASEIAKIVAEDDYVVVDVQDVLPGDIAVYYKDGDAEHSGIVVGLHKVQHLNVPVILSKWGACHEVIHLVSQCPFDSRNVTYYRIDQ